MGGSFRASRAMGALHANLMSAIENATLTPETEDLGAARPTKSGPAPVSSGLCGARVEFPRDKCICQLVEEQVQRTPSATALICGGERLTYSELNGRANQVAHRLRRLGVGPGVLVGLFMERSFELVIGLLGILKSGGAYVPIDPVYPKDRIAFMLEDADVKVLVTQPKLEGLLPRHAATVLPLVAEESRFPSDRDENPLPTAGPDDLAYVMFTSGSTGKPKGALVTHHNVVRLLRATEGLVSFQLCRRVDPVPLPRF